MTEQVARSYFATITRAGERFVAHLSIESNVFDGEDWGTPEHERDLGRESFESLSEAKGWLEEKVGQTLPLDEAEPNRYWRGFLDIDEVKNG